ncbi:MAG: hypothetical protein IBJ03_11260 [Gemmatimonadaceae bacterium]|nr:hypothetical protein [Gemmatimonadaceae bacterium]
MIRRVLASAALVAVAASVAAASAFADFSGKWNLSIQSPDQARTAVLTLEQKGDSVAGTTETELGSAAVRGVVKGDSLFFGFQLDMGGQAIPISGSAALKDKDNMEGALEVTGMGGMGFTGARQK